MKTQQPVSISFLYFERYLSGSINCLQQRIRVARGAVGAIGAGRAPGGGMLGAQAAPAGEVVAEKLCPHSSFEFLDLI
jgi:hypothetical protein